MWQAFKLRVCLLTQNPKYIFVHVHSQDLLHGSLSVAVVFVSLLVCLQFFCICELAGLHLTILLCIISYCEAYGEHI